MAAVLINGRTASILLLLLIATLAEARRTKRSAGAPSRDSDPQSIVEDMTSLKKFVDVSYLRCAYQSQALLRVPEPQISTTSTSTNHRFPFFVGTDGKSTTAWQPVQSSNALGDDIPLRQRRMRACHQTSNCTTNPCGLQWIEDSELYSGLDALILVGDSTLLRLFQHITKVRGDAYEAKVGQLESDFLNRTVPLSSGRNLPVFFLRALHVSTAIGAVDHAFKLASTPNCMIVFSFGPHDTSWLVFRRPMPGFRRAHTGVWNHARIYWNRFVTTLVHYIAFRLKEYEERGNGFVDDDHSEAAMQKRRLGRSRAFRRPVVVFREQYLANCGHPKYSKYPLITRCGDLLMPVVIPHYRSYLAALTSLVNIPTVGLDELLRPSNSNGAASPPDKPLCSFVDAGHMNRACHRYELQLLMQAFRMTRRLGVEQGYVPSRHGASPIFKLIQQAGLGARWERVFELVRSTPPHGYSPTKFLSCHQRGVPLLDVLNTSADDGPLCELPQSAQEDRRWNQQQLHSAKRVFDAFDHGPSLELDVAVMDGIDIHQQRHTRCSRQGLWSSPLLSAVEQLGDFNASQTSDGADDMQPAITMLVPTAPPWSPISVSTWAAFIACTLVVVLLVFQIYRQ